MIMRIGTKNYFKVERTKITSKNCPLLTKKNKLYKIIIITNMSVTKSALVRFVVYLKEIISI